MYEPPDFTDLFNGFCFHYKLFYFVFMKRFLITITNSNFTLFLVGIKSSFLVSFNRCLVIGYFALKTSWSAFSSCDVSIVWRGNYSAIWQQRVQISAQSQYKANKRTKKKQTIHT